jgi:putative membrane protein
VNVDLPMSSAFHVHFQPWSFSLPVTLALILVALVYLRGWFRLGRDLPNTIPLWRLAAFMSGLSLSWIVVGSPLSALDHESLTIHMINHLVLMALVAPLVLAGAPYPLLLHALPVGTRLHDLLHNLPARRLGRLLKHPVFCWLVATATVIGWHLPAVFQLAMQSHSWHAVEYASFMLAGLLFWLPVVQPASSACEWPRWSTPLYLFMATLPCDILSAFLVFCGRVVYPSYLSSLRLFNLSALQDQQCAGALMWVAVTFAYLLPAMVITIRILSPQRAHSRHPVQVMCHRPAPSSSSSSRGSPAEVVYARRPAARPDVTSAI